MCSDITLKRVLKGDILFFPQHLHESELKWPYKYQRDQTTAYAEDHAKEE